MNNIYLAGPIQGLRHGEAESWRKQIIRLLDDASSEVNCLSPMRAKDKLRNVGVINTAYEELGCLYSAHGIMSRDFHDCTTSSMVIFNFLGAKKISVGTVMELAWAYQARIPTVVITEKEGNIHEHPMVNEAINFRVDSIEEAVEVALSVLGL